MSSSQKIYEQHHENSRQVGFSILKKERGELLAKLIGSGNEVLDIGCRDGALTQYFMEGNKILGVDVDRKALARASKLGIETKLMDLHNDWADLIDRSFDRIVAGEVLEHLYYPEEIIKKVRLQLKPGGLFIGSVPNAFSLKNRLRYLIGQKKYTPLSDPTHINHFSSFELKNILEKYFKNVRIIGLGRYKKLSKLFPGVFAFDLFFIAHN